MKKIIMIGSMVFAFCFAVNVDAMKSDVNLSHEKNDAVRDQVEVKSENIQEVNKRDVVRDNLLGHATAELFRLESKYNLNPVSMIFKLMAAGLPTEFDDKIAKGFSFNLLELPTALKKQDNEHLKSILAECSAIEACESQAEAITRLKELLTSLGITR